MTETTAIAGTAAGDGPLPTALELLCAEPLLRAPLLDRLTGDGHLVTLHADAGALDPHWEPVADLVVMVPPSSPLDFVRDGWSALLRALLGRRSMVLVAAAAAVSPGLLAATDGHRDHGLVVLDRDGLDGEWPAAVSASVSLARQGRREIAPALRRTGQTPSGLGALTPHERTILGLIAEGLSNAAIAEVQYVGERTVESHIRRIYAKLDLADSPAVQRRVLATRLFLGEQRAVSAGT
ncbi:MAG: hypothetical protein KGR18_07190 [Acidobacteria bacterium]|nr:hypothetical protein [Acidobacteriota bacterium]